MRTILLVAVVGCGFHVPADDGPRGCYASWLAGTVAFSGIRAITELNSPSYDRDPTISADDLTIYWSTQRSGSTGGDVWTATRANRDAVFGAPTLRTDINSAGNETRMTMTMDGLLAAVGSDRAGSAGGIDVWLATRTSTDAPFDAPVRSGLDAINNADSQHDPFLTDDGRRLYFAPTTGGQHIELAERTSRTAPFGSPTVLINSGSGDADPTLSPDQRVLVFSSRRSGSDASDLWFATRDDATATFGTPTKLPSPASSLSDDGDPSLSADGCRLYFSSTRPGGLGDYDLYVADVTP